MRPDHVERICDLLIKRGIRKRYTANARIEVARFPHMLEKAYRAGFRMLLFGLESASDKTLAQLHKGFTVQQMRGAFAVLRQFPFFYHGYFIYGNLGETESDMLAIADLARDLGVHTITLNRLRVDTYTPLRTQIEALPGHRISPNGYVYSPEFDRTRLLRIRNRIRDRFLYRPAQMAKLLAAANNCEIITYRQMAYFALRSPLFLYDYAAHLGHKVLKELRHRAKQRLVQGNCGRSDTLPTPPGLSRPAVLGSAPG